jgi:hypothetical protein
MQVGLAASFTSAAAVGLMVASCGQSADEYGPRGTIEFQTERPQLMEAEAPPPYTGSDPYVLEALELHPTGSRLHKNVIIRTCGPTAGVCHNQKEYPGLNTQSKFLDAIDAPCNVQPGDWAAVYDGCEQQGARIRLNGSTQVEIGWVELIPGSEDLGGDNRPGMDSPGLHINLQAPIDIGGDGHSWGTAEFVSNEIVDGKVKEVATDHYDTEWFMLEGGTHLVGEVREWQVDRVTALVGAGIAQGDMNRNGIFGAREAAPLNMLKAGDPEASYMIGRLRGELKGERIPGTRMPLANEPLTIADMLALFCLVESIPVERTGLYDLETPINYEECSWAEDPEGLNLLGQGATWLGRVQPLLVANCAGCHNAEEPQSGFDVESEGLYERLLASSTQVPDMPYVTPGDPTQSYLWVKLTGAEGLLGLEMPLDATNMPRRLEDGALGDIETWINNGALAEE